MTKHQKGQTTPFGVSQLPRGGNSKAILETACKNRIPVNGVVIGYNTVGFFVKIMDFRAFCSMSNFELNRTKKPEFYINNSYDFLINEFQEKGRYFVVSRIALLKKEDVKKKEQNLQRIKVGDVLEGKVSSLHNFGAFVSMNGTEGFIHISEISREWINHPKEVLTLGQKVKAKILQIEEQAGKKPPRISLTLRGVVDVSQPGSGIVKKSIVSTGSTPTHKGANTSYLPNPDVRNQTHKPQTGAIAILPITDAISVDNISFKSSITSIYKNNELVKKVGLASGVEKTEFKNCLCQGSNENCLQCFGKGTYEVSIGNVYTTNAPLFHAQQTFNPIQSNIPRNTSATSVRILPKKPFYPPTTQPTQDSIVNCSYCGIKLKQIYRFKHESYCFVPEHPKTPQLKAFKYCQYCGAKINSSKFTLHQARICPKRPTPLVSRPPEGQKNTNSSYTPEPIKGWTECKVCNEMIHPDEESVHSHYASERQLLLNSSTPTGRKKNARKSNETRSTDAMDLPRNRLLYSAFESNRRRH